MYVQWNSLLSAMAYIIQQQTLSKTTNEAKIEFNHTIQPQTTAKPQTNHKIEGLDQIDEYSTTNNIKNNKQE